jgi:excisionase family DNA binding protein
MLTIKQITERLHVSASIVYGWIASGMLAHFRLGASGRRGVIRVAEADLDSFLDSMKKGKEAIKPAAFNSIPSQPRRRASKLTGFVFLPPKAT